MNIQLQHVSAGYGRGHVLQDISLEIPEGSAVAILGVNGSGKTTLLRTLAGVLPYEGTILLHGREVRSMKRREIASQIAMLVQLGQTYFSYTVEETVMLGRYLKTNNRFGIPTEEDRKTVDACLRLTGLSEYRDQPVDRLSGGQQQRAFLARTLAQDTPIILLDEPTNHLDLKVQTELMEYVAAWRRQEGHTLIGVYHDINLAFSMADRIILMKDGRILKQGAAKDLIEDGSVSEAYGLDVKAYMKKQYEAWQG